MNLVYRALSRTSALTVVVLWATAPAWPATTRHVWPDSPAPAPPYADWTTAAHVIQDAVDAAEAGDLVLVTNGVYATGGKAVAPATLTNRVAVTKPLRLASVNGPQATIIQGAKAPGGGFGDGAVRCVYLADGASLSGFTLTNGATRGSFDYERETKGGGAWCSSANVILTNCSLTGNSAEYGGGASMGTLNNCTLTGNSANFGGGAFFCTLNNCTLTGNSAETVGGGAFTSTLNNCTLTGNSADSTGGGAYTSTLNNCTLTGNSARYGGGAASSDLNNCTLTGNPAGSSGGGASNGTLNNCTLTGNSAGFVGGGAASSDLNNCTLTGNSAASFGGGASGGTLNNCIVCFNQAEISANYSGGTLNYCCTTPLPTGGQGNLSLDPQLASASHLSAGSPCRGAGRAAYATGVDLDGEAWATPPAIGCDEYHAGSATGTLNLGIAVAVTNAVVGKPLKLRALIEGWPAASAWEFGDGGTATNQPYTAHAWSAPGHYAVVLRAYNASHPEGVSATVTIRVVDAAHYVAADSPAPAPPYADWTTAAHVIQDAVDAAEAGDLVLVTNGVYATGGMAVGPVTLATRVAVTKPLHLASVNGPEATIIQGAKAPGGGNGKGAVRCVYLADGASLSGFTLTDGATLSIPRPQHPADTFTELYACGGGAHCSSTNAILTNCVLTGNSADGWGGGAYRGTLNNCVLTGNSASDCGGAFMATLNNCVLTGNSAGSDGGGACHGILINCTLTGNSAGSDGGGAYGGTLSNCTLTGNSAASSGGGVSESTSKNCLVYFNQGGTGANYYRGTLDYCCTTPLPAGGQGNLSLDPQLASTSHLSAGSPCRGTGSLAYATGVDLDGEPWATPPAIGCDEYYVGTATGPLSVSIAATFTNAMVAYPVQLTGLIEGRPAACAWEFGDGATATNQPYTAHTWSAPGDYAVVLRAYNATHPNGVSASVTVRVEWGEAVRYVAAESSQPRAPYTSWATAARNLQDAVDAAAAGDLVLVNNGVYAMGGRAVGTDVLTNRVAVTKPLRLESVNGPQATMIRGNKASAGGAVRGVYLVEGASLSGFTVTGGQATQNGGGVHVQGGTAVITNCVLTGNSADHSGGGAHGGILINCTLSGNSANNGGGAYGGSLVNCRLTGNSAIWSGGGAESSALNHCVLADNSAGRMGGGAGSSTLNNCLLTGNSGAPGRFDDGGYVSGCTLNNCTVIGILRVVMPGDPRAYLSTLNNCILYNSHYSHCTLNYCWTMQLPTNGVGNITGEPRFVDLANGNLRLQPDSPCINAGQNAFAPGTTDLDGRPRIVGGRVDMGAYEFQSSGSVEFYAWLQSYGLPTDGSADFADPDTDGLNTWQEWRCLTNPTNALSVLRLLSATPAETGVTVSWPGVDGVTYFLERSLDLGASPPFSPLATNLSGPSGIRTFTDTNAAASPTGFYRVGVGP